MCLKGSAIDALSALPYAMAADVIDLDSAQTGKRQGGAYFSIWTMTRKLAYALGLVVGTTAATIVGFNSLADPINDPTALTRCYGSHACIPSCPRSLSLCGAHALELLANRERLRKYRQDCRKGAGHQSSTSLSVGALMRPRAAHEPGQDMLSQLLDAIWPLPAGQRYG